MEGVRIKKKLDKKRGAPEEGKGLHFQPIFVLAFLKSVSTQVLPSKKKNQMPHSGKTWNLDLKNLFHLFQECRGIFGRSPAFARYRQILTNKKINRVLFFFA